MKTALLALFATLALVSCSHHETTADAKKKLDKKYEDLVGTATKNDLVQEFGTPEWCRMQDSGWENCRFYRKKGTQWMGPKTDRTHYDSYDQIMAEFDGNGVLKSFKASAQR
jgi:hypothetical protein